MQAPWLDSLRDVQEIGASRVALLGSLVSGPPLAPFELIRQVRRAVFGEGTLYLEAMLAESDLVESVSKDGIELTQEFRAVAHRVLRERVLSGEIPETELRAATHCEHLPLSPLLALEEQLVWTYISLRDPSPECDRLLSDCLLSIVREDRHQILDWAAGALHRLPDLVVATQAAWLLSELCNALQRETRRLPPPPVEQIEHGLLQEVLPFLPSALVGFHRDGTSLSLGPTSRRRRTAFAVPGIALRPVTVTWIDPGPIDGQDAADVALRSDDANDPQGRHHEVTVDATGPVDLIPVGRSAVRLRTVSGAVISLEAFGAEAIAPELIELNRSLDLLEDAWRNARSVTAVVLRTVSAYGAIVRFVDAWAISGHLRFDRSYLEGGGIKPWNLVGQEIDVRISSFERQYQRIMCRPAPPTPWSPGTLLPGQEVEGRFNNAVNFGFFAEVPTTERGFDGPTIVGLVHNSTFPSWWLKRAETFQKGDTLQLRVLGIDQERNRISLEISNANVMALLPEGAIFSGQVVKVVPFGVFVEVPPGIDGLLHNTEIEAECEIDVGDNLLVRIIRADYEKGRISFAMEPRLPEDAPSRQAGKTRAEIGEENRIEEMPVGDFAHREAVAEFIRRQFPADGTAAHISTIAMLVRARFGTSVTDNWLGYKRFRLMLSALVPEAQGSGATLRLRAERSVGGQAPLTSHDNQISATHNVQQGAAVAAYIRVQLRQLQNPILVSALEKMVAAKFGPLVHDWLGYKMFRPMLTALVPEAKIIGRAVYPLVAGA